MPEGDAAAFECSSGATPSTPPLEFDETVTSDEVSDPKSTARTRVTCFVFFCHKKCPIACHLLRPQIKYDEKKIKTKKKNNNKKL